MSVTTATGDVLRIGIVGCGRVSRVHAAAYQRVGGTHVVSVFDVNRAAAEALAKDTGATVAASLDEMVHQHQLHAVSICTPPRFHLEHARPFLRAGIAVLCEKPLTTTVPEARQLAALVRRHRAVFMVGFCHRFHPPILALRELLSSSALGRPLLFRVTFASRSELASTHRAQRALSGGGCLIDNGSHAVDLFRFLVGEIQTITAATVARLVQRTPVEDFALLSWRGYEGCVGEFVTGYSFPNAPNFVEVWCEKGVATVRYGEPDQPEFSYWREEDTARTVPPPAGRPDRFTAEVAHFLECVRAGQPPSVGINDGVAAVRIIDQAYRKAKRR